MNRIVKFINLHITRYFAKSYSQEGEDMILRRIFSDRKIGFYVDVGAFHPKRFSNTYYFYKLGWHGINIDPNPDNYALFNIIRKKDINICAAISSGTDNRLYYMFKEPAYNTLDQTKAKEYEDYTTLIREIQVECKPLSKILYENVSAEQEIDFLNIDVEGLDIQVLKSNDWNRFKPKIIVIEQFGSTMNEVLSSEIASFLKIQGYNPIAKTINSVFYKYS